VSDLVINVPQEVNETAEQVNNTDAGNALVITDPNMEAPGVSVNETSNQTNNTDASVQSQNSQTLTAETMKTIRGKVIWKAAAVFGFINMGMYFMGTPRNQWTWQGSGAAFISGAAPVILGPKIAAKWGAKKVASKAARRPPRRPPRWRWT